MTRYEGADAYVPANADIPALRDAAKGCQGCDLYRNATQTVFGEGPTAADLFMVGEQPGDHEDRDGRPFVGPAGRVLDRALHEVGIDRTAVYLTNAVKHFSFRLDERGKRRIHQRPRASEITACRPWLAAELRLVRPKLVLCLGAVAVSSVVGSGFRLTEHRGQILPRPDSAGLPGDWSVAATIHPSAVLRAPDRDQAYRELVDDLRPVARFLD